MREKRTINLDVFWVIGFITIILFVNFDDYPKDFYDLIYEQMSEN